MQVTDFAKQRYSTKAFDASKKIPANLVDEMETLLQLGASSVNSQPWHFIVASTDEGKTRIAKSTEGMFAYNKAKVLNASHVVIFCSKTDLNAEHLLSLTEQEAADGRFKDEASKKEQHEKRSMYANLHKDVMKDLPVWTSNQTYLNVGSFLLGVSGLGLDAVPMEGFDASVIDKEFGLKEKDLKSLVIVAVGYRSAEDFNAKLPKSRLQKKHIITRV